MPYEKKNKMHHKMQREKLYNLHSKGYCICFQKKKNSVRSIVAMPKIWSLKTLSILKTKGATTK
jgi:hypothetical protein